MFAVFGDIHGCFYTLKKLHTRVKEIYGEIDFYATGDLVDRGNYSPEAVEYVIENGSITNSDVKRIMDVSKRTASRYLSFLENNYIRKVGETGVGTIYCLKGTS